MLIFSDFDWLQWEIPEFVRALAWGKRHFIIFPVGWWKRQAQIKKRAGDFNSFGFSHEADFGPDAKSHDFRDFWSSPARFKEDFSLSATLPRNVQREPPYPGKFFWTLPGVGFAIIVAALNNVSDSCSFLVCLALRCISLYCFHASFLSCLLSLFWFLRLILLFVPLLCDCYFACSLARLFACLLVCLCVCPSFCFWLLWVL